MKKSQILLICMFVVVLAAAIAFAFFLPKNIFQTTSGDSDYKIVWGLAEDTKDGYYVNGNVLLEEEIIRYKPDYKSGQYSGKHLVITSKIRTERNDDCTSPTGEIVQCRLGESSYFYDIKSIEEKNI